MKGELVKGILVHQMMVSMLAISILLLTMSTMTTLATENPLSTEIVCLDNNPIETKSAEDFAIAEEALGKPPIATLWDYRYDVHSTDFGTGMTLCSDDGYAVVGSSWGLLGWANRDGFLIKTNASGEREWTKGYGAAPEDDLENVDECASGGYLLVGETQSYGAGGDDIWLIKTDVDGNMIWNRTFGGSGEDKSYAVKECSNGWNSRV